METDREQLEEFIESKNRVCVSEIRDHFEAEIDEEFRDLDDLILELKEDNYISIKNAYGDKEKDDNLSPDAMVSLIGEK